MLGGKWKLSRPSRNGHILISMTEKSRTKPKLTDAERHRRFVEMALEVEASDDPKDFEKAFKKVISPKQTKPRKSR